MTKLKPLFLVAAVGTGIALASTALAGDSETLTTCYQAVASYPIIRSIATGAIVLGCAFGVAKGGGRLGWALGKNKNKEMAGLVDVIGYAVIGGILGLLGGGYIADKLIWEGEKVPCSKSALIEQAPVQPTIAETLKKHKLSLV